MEDHAFIATRKRLRDGDFATGIPQLRFGALKKDAKRLMSGRLLIFIRYGGAWSLFGP